MSIIQNYIDRNKDNPNLKDMLKGRSLNKTTLADIAGVTYRVVHLSDQALYDALPPKLAAFMNDPKNNNGYTRNVYASNQRIDWEIEYLAYKEFLLNKLESKYAREQPLWLHTKPDLIATTFVDWREQVASSQMEFSRMFLINPTILHHYESGTTQNLPVVIRERLEYFGMPESYIASLSALELG